MWCNVVGYTFLNIKHFIVVHINSLKPLLLSLLLSEDKPWHISFKWTFISIVLTHQTFCKFSKFWNVHTIYNCCHVSKTCCSCKLSNWSWVWQIVFKYRYSLIKDLCGFNFCFLDSIVFILYIQVHVPGTDFERILIVISSNCS